MIVTNENFYESFCALKAMLDARHVSLDERHYIIVPDKCSLYAERFLFSGSGAFDAEVLSFGRLYIKFREPEVGFLPRAGAVMLTGTIIRKQKKHFRVFGTAAEFPGLAEKMYDAVCAASAAGLSPSDLTTSTHARENVQSAAELKLDDIRRVYADYTESIRGRYVDADGRTQLLAKALASADLSRTKFYIAGFDRFTKAEEAVLDLVRKRAAAYTEFRVAPPAYQFGEAEFYESVSVSDRIKAAAVRIRREVIEGAAKGVRYRDFCVLAPLSLSLPLARIFTEFEIPYYIDEKRTLSEFALFRFIELCEAACASYRRPLLIALSKNHYAGIDRRQADAFEDYVTERGINYGGFLEPFCGAECDCGDVQAAEQVRKMLLTMLDRFRAGYRGVDAPARFRQFLVQLFADCNARERTLQLSEVSGTDLSQIEERLLEIAELLKVTAPVDAPPTELFRLFCEGVRATNISLVAGKSDAVVVGGAETFRGGKFKTVFVPDFCEGVVPEVRDCAGLIAEAEAEVLQKRGLSAPPLPSELNVYSEHETVRLFGLADKLFLAYSDEGGNRLSDLGIRIMAGAKRYYRTSAAEERRALETHGVTPDAVSCKQHALELLLLSCARSIAGGTALKETAELRAVCSGAEEPFIKSATSMDARTALEESGALFLSKKHTSVSRIQTYFECPYRCFIKHGLRLKERDDGVFSAPDAGKLLHRAAELFVSGGDFCNPEQSMRAVVEGLAQTEYAELACRAPIRFARVCDEAVRLARPIAASYTAGAFRNLATEARFGFAERVAFARTLSWNGRYGEQRLCGVIDRVDVFDSFARVVDYKSGSGRNAKFSFSELYYGRALQLSLYLKVLSENGYRPAGMFYFPLTVKFSDGEDAHRLSGVFCDDEQVVAALDAGLAEAGYQSTVLNAKRNTSVNRKTKRTELYKSDSHTDEAGLRVLTDYAYRAAGGALDEIAEGYIKPSPLKGVCAYCKFGALCGFDPERNKVRKTETIRLCDILQAGGADA